MNSFFKGQLDKIFWRGFLEAVWPLRVEVLLPIFYLYYINRRQPIVRSKFPFWPPKKQHKQFLKTQVLFISLLFCGMIIFYRRNFKEKKTIHTKSLKIQISYSLYSSLYSSAVSWGVSAVSWGVSAVSWCVSAVSWGVSAVSWGVSAVRWYNTNICIVINDVQ